MIKPVKIFDNKFIYFKNMLILVLKTYFFEILLILTLNIE